MAGFSSGVPSAGASSNAQGSVAGAGRPPCGRNSTSAGPVPVGPRGPQSDDEDDELLELESDAGFDSFFESAPFESFDESPFASELPSAAFLLP
jgi:hypothetical protein